MSKDNIIKLDGTITEVLRNTNYRVKLDNFEAPILATPKWSHANEQYQMFRRRRTVEVELSPYDLSRGRISRRR
jgi:translation initiation factor IF-1